MKKIVLFFLVMTSFLFGAEVQWAKDYASALTQAKATSKPILLLVEKENCPYCELLKEDVLTKASVAKLINTQYIPVKVMQEDGSYPAEAFYVFGTPTTFFVDDKGEKYMRPIIGYVEKERYMRLLEKGLER